MQRFVPVLVTNIAPGVASGPVGRFEAVQNAVLSRDGNLQKPPAASLQMSSNVVAFRFFLALHPGLAAGANGRTEDCAQIGDVGFRGRVANAIGRSLQHVGFPCRGERMAGFSKVRVERSKAAADARPEQPQQCADLLEAQADRVQALDRIPSAGIQFRQCAVLLLDGDAAKRLGQGLTGLNAIRHGAQQAGVRCRQKQIASLPPGPWRNKVPQIRRTLHKRGLAALERILESAILDFDAHRTTVTGVGED
jgi:hypothetical protein